MNFRLSHLQAMAALAYLSLFLILDASISATYSRSVTHEKQLKEFYGLLESLRTASISDQISALGAHLNGNPDFDRVYHKLLETYLQQGKLREAEAFFQQLTISSNHRRNSYWILARIYTCQDDLEKAFSAYQEALSHDQPSSAFLKDFAEFSQRLQGKLNHLIVLSESSLSQPDRVLYAAFLSFMDLDYNKTIKEMLKLPKTRLQDLLVMQILEVCYLILGRDAEADSILQRGSKIAREIGDLYNEALFLKESGYYWFVKRKYDEASRYYEQAVSIANRINDLYLQESIIGYIGHLNNLRGDYSAAIEKYRQAEEIAKSICDDQSLRIWLRSRAELLFVSGRYNEALRAYHECEKIVAKINNKPAMLDLKLKMASAYSYLNQTDLNIKTLKEAEELARQLNLMERQSLIKARFADLDARAGKYAQAREAYREYMNFLRIGTTLRSKAYWMAKIADTYKAQRLYEEAKIEYQHALEAARRAGSKTYEAWNQLDLAEVEVLLGNYKEAIKEYAIVLNSDIAQKEKEIRSSGYLGLGNAHKKIGDLTQAIANYKKSVNIIEEFREEFNAEQLRIGYFSKSQKVYRKLVESYYQNYLTNMNRAEIDSIFIFYEKSRSRTLQEVKLRDLLKIDAAKQNEMASEYLKTCERLRSLQRRLRLDYHRPKEQILKLNAELEATRYSLIEQRLKLAQATQTSKPTSDFITPSLERVLNLLKEEKTGLLIYYISEEAAFVVAAVDDEVQVVPLHTNRSSLASMTNSLLVPLHRVQNNSSVKSTPFKAEVAHRLYKELVQPVEDALVLPSKLLIVPDLTLANLPFEMLLVSSPDAPIYAPSDSATYADSFLLHRYAIAYCPSTKVLQDEPGSSFGDPNVLIFANPFGGAVDTNDQQHLLTLREIKGWRFEPLIFAGFEAEGIRKLHSRTKVYELNDASKANFWRETPQYDILHLATHAFVDTTFEAFSGLLLATGEDSTDDGLLMGYEISDLDLPLDLVTLSACETGSGKLVEGEGLLGLPRLFLGAGTKTVLMTLWKVDDKFASDLMPEFYDFFINQGLPKADALAKAKRSLLSRKLPRGSVYYQHPFYWASFALYGDPGTSRSTFPPPKPFVIVIAILLILAVIFFLYRRLHLKGTVTKIFLSLLLR